MPTDQTKLLMLPGMEGSGLFFQPLQRHLGPDLDAEVISYPQDRVVPYRELVENVVERFPSHRPFVILGESYGGPLALMAAARASDNLLGLILVATFVTSPVSRWLRLASGPLCRPLLALRPKKTLMSLFLAGGCPPETVKWVHANMPELPPKIVCGRLKDVFEVDASRALVTCPLPILYIRPGRDRLVRAGSLKRILAFRPDVTVRTIDGPHMVLQCAPEESAQAIRNWMRGLR